MSRTDRLHSLHGDDILFETREIYILDSISCEDESIDLKTAVGFLKNLRLLELEGNDRITVHQYSHGGSWEAGMAIFDAIVNSPCEFNYICHGTACSLGSILPQACAYKKASYRLINPRCTFMIHEGSMDWNLDNTRKQKSWIRWSDDGYEMMLDIYAQAAYGSERFSGLSQNVVREKIHALIKEHDDWILTPQECTMYGFMDAIIGTNKAQAIIEQATRTRKSVK